MRARRVTHKQEESRSAGMRRPPAQGARPQNTSRPDQEQPRRILRDRQAGGKVCVGQRRAKGKGCWRRVSPHRECRLSRPEAGQDHLPLARETEPGGIVPSADGRLLPREGFSSCRRPIGLPCIVGSPLQDERDGEPTLAELRSGQADKSAAASGQPACRPERTCRTGCSCRARDNTPRREPRTDRHCSTTGNAGSRCWSLSGSQRPPESSASSCSCSGKREGREGGPIQADWL